MANTNINVRVRTRYDTESNWSSKNPVLLAGEMAISSDKNGMYKVGDGTSTWSALKYSKSLLEKSDVVAALGYTPPSSDTNNKVTNILNTTTKAYVTGTTSATTNTGTQIFDTGVYLGTAAGQLVARTFVGNLTGNVTGNVSGNAGSATKLQTARTINGTSFNGTANIVITAEPKLTTLTNQNLNDIKTLGFYNAGGGNTVTNNPAGSGTAFGMIVYKNASGYWIQEVTSSSGAKYFRIFDSTNWGSWVRIYTSAYAPTSVSGNAGTATKLATARTINGTSFDGTSNITTANWGTARTITIGNSAKSVNGAGNVSWTLSEIGAAASSHTHNYAGSASAGGAANSVKSGLIIKLNSGSTEGTNMFTFNGSAAKTVNITPSAIGAAASSHTHSYLPLSGGTMNGTAVINWPDSGNWSNDNEGVKFPVKRGGLKWSGQSDSIEMYSEETASDNLNLVIKFGDDNSNGISIKDKDGTQKAFISANGVFTGSFTGSLTGNASTATKLQTARTINGTSFDGSGNITTSNWGTARTITIGNSRKSVNGSANVSWSLSDIGAAASSHTHNYAGSASAGGAANSVKSAFTIKLNGGATEGTNLFTYNGSTAKTINITASSIGAAASSHTHTKSQITDFPASLKNPNSLTIQFNGTSQGAYDGSAAKTINITPGGIGAATASHTHNYAGSSSAGGSATSAVRLATARTINGTSFNGTANITTANWGSARTLTIGSSAKSVNGSANVSWTLAEIGAAASSHTHNYAGSASAGGSANSAVKLATARTINGTSFNGSANITTANWGTARTLTIGNSGKSVNGSGNVSWSLSEIGAAAASHTHSYLPLSGGTVTGLLTIQKGTQVHTATGTSGTSGYIKIATIKITGGYQNIPLAFEVYRRQATQPTKLYITFSSVKSADPTLNKFYYEGQGSSTAFALYKSTTSTWNLYIQKAEGYDNIGIAEYHTNFSYMSGTTVTFSNVQEALPSSGITYASLLRNPASSTAGSLTLQFNGASQTAFNGGSNLTLNITPSAIGAAASSHTHSYLPLSGGTLTGTVTFNSSATGDVLKIMPTDSEDTYWKIIAGNESNFGCLSFNSYKNTDDSLIDSFTFNPNGILTCKNLITTSTITVKGTGSSFESRIAVGGDIAEIWLRSSSSMSKSIRFMDENYTDQGGIYCNMNSKCSLIFSGGVSLSGRIQFSEYDSTTSFTLSSSPNLYINSSGFLYKSSSSSRRYKYNITENISASLDPTLLYNLPVVQYQYNPGYLGCDPMGTQCHIGFIAEDVADIYPVAAEYNPDGTVEMWNFKEILPGMLKLIQDQHTVQEDHEKRIAELEAEVAYWKGKFESGT